MHLEFSILRNKASADLPAVTQLGALKDKPFNNAALGFRHPLGVYNVSIEAIAAAFADALDAASQYGEFSATVASRLARTLDHLVDASTEHFDDLKSIVRLVFDSDGPQGSKRAIREFDATVKTARAFSARQANAIKHQQGRIRFVRVLFGGTPLHLGYFIDGVDNEGVLGPSQDVHLGATAFSLCRTFRYIACSVLFSSRVLAAQLSSKYGPVDATTGFGPLMPIFDRLANFNSYVFWDELNDCPTITANADLFKISTSTHTGLILPPAGGRIEGTFGGDGTSSNFRLPYFGKEYRKGTGRKKDRTF